MPVKITFILIKDEQVQLAETIDAEVDAIQRRISRIQCDGYDSTVIVFGNGEKWDVRFPMTLSQIEKTSIKLIRNL
jgi:hypothetical protein